MNEEKLIKTVNWLLFLASAFLFYGLTYYVTDEHSERRKQPQAEKVEVIKVLEPKVETKPNPKPFDFTQQIPEVVVYTYTTIETEFLGYYFVTAYCPEECGGSWQTSSGATCHYSDDWTEPTTCAIDRSVHGYNELLMVGEPDDPDRKIYITEDTGPGVQGYWIDCFVETMDEVRAWPTGWMPVYAVHFEEHQVIKTKGELFHEYFKHYLLLRSSGSWSDLRDDCRVND